QWWYVAGIVFVVVAVVAAVVLLVNRNGGPAKAPTIAVPETGCSNVTTIPSFGTGDQDRAHIGNSEFTVGPPLTDYPTQPPTSGPHDAGTVSAGFYTK